MSEADALPADRANVPKGRGPGRPKRPPGPAVDRRGPSKPAPRTSGPPPAKSSAAKSSSLSAPQPAAPTPSTADQPLTADETYWYDHGLAAVLALETSDPEQHDKHMDYIWCE